MRICTQDEFYFSFPAGTLEPADPWALFALVLDGQSVFEVGTEIDQKRVRRISASPQTIRSRRLTASPAAASERSGRLWRLSYSP